MKVRINTHGGPIPEKHGDWYDLTVSKDTKVEFMKATVIPLGISVDTPEGFTTYILPRSSTPMKHQIVMVNSIGVIDNGYHGDNDIIGFVAWTWLPWGKTIRKGTRIAQMAIVRSPEAIEFESVDSLGNDDRGGFGSTGVMADGAEKH